MRNLALLSAVFGILLLLPNSTLGQSENDSTLCEIEIKDGNRFIGTIVLTESDTIHFKTITIGTIHIPKNLVKKITPLAPNQLKEGEFWADNPQSTRYFFSPNGFGMKKGEGYYQNVWVLFNQVSFSITDNTSLGAGIVPLFLFAGTSSPAWIAPKFSLPVVKDKFNVGGGALIGTILGEEEAGFGILYGVSTFGDRNNNLNIGLGYGYAGGGLAKTPTITVSTMLRTGPRGYFISENYYISTADDYMILLSLGGRGITRGGVGIDWGVVLPLGSGIGEFVAIPWLGITLPFKPKN
ncbi:MAG: hypothetical protein KQI35_08410 [Bacteroidetes bacterium]|nr:hypothetical protein [Bacteroidota bacterium]